MPRIRIDRRIALLKSPNYSDHSAGHAGTLPYRIDLLREFGFELRWTDGHERWPWTVRPLRALISRFEAGFTPLLQTLLLLPTIMRSSIVLAMFESEGHAFALLRSFGLFRRKRFVVIACWLADLAQTSTTRRVALYRRLYRRVDLVVVFSENQREILVATLGIPRGRIAVVPFGVDLSEWEGVATSDSGRVVAIGRDEGRDWRTLIEAVRGTGLEVVIAARPRALEGIDLPTEVTFVGLLDREAYMQLLASASVVAIICEDRAYPSGQTVLLESLGLAKPCVVTRTEAMRHYLAAGVVQVPVHDAISVRASLCELASQRQARVELGLLGAQYVKSHFSALDMWSSLSKALQAI